jgi:hypothetical protein
MKLPILLIASVAALLPACVQDRPARNGVFNENQYVRKDFLVRSGEDPGSDATPTTDPGWILKATVVQTSSPNPLGGDAVSIFPGMENGGALVRFRLTQNKLEMVDQRELADNASVGKTQEVLDAWPATHIDLKYRVNLDGENTNFYEENQEQPWQERQYVKVQFDKNDLSDVNVFGPYTTYGMNRCTDAAASTVTLVPDSFVVNTDSNYMTWTNEITVAVKWDDAACVESFGPMGDVAAAMGRNNVTFRVMYSLTRANPAPTYVPLEVAEKDPIHHKYGPIEYTKIQRDENSGMLAAKQLVMRFDPTKPIVWYFADGFPDQYKAVFTGPGGVAERTNKLFEAAGAAARLTFKDFNADLPENHDDRPPELVNGRQYGDARFNFVRWLSDKDTEDSFAGIAQFVTDPRTGETLSASINLNDFAIKDYYVQRLDFYLQTVGASAGINGSTEWPDLCPDGTLPACLSTKDDSPVPCDANHTPRCKYSDSGAPGVVGTCTDGVSAPIVDATVANVHNASSPVFGKMQEYLQKPLATNGPLGPKDFLQVQDPDFLKAYFALLPYYIYADPAMNAFVTPEGQGGVNGPGEMWKMLEQEAQFHKIAGDIDHGLTPFAAAGADGLKQATAFANQWRQLTLNHQALPNRLHKARPHLMKDAPESFTFERMMAKDARHCVGGKWETKAQWTDGLIQSYWSQVMWHEFGHVMGLEHNFMGSVDANNFLKDKTSGKVGLYSSSVMEYNAGPDRVFWTPDWAPYDAGAIAWIYANDKAKGTAGDAISGQASATAPWKDPMGFASDGKETQFLFCSHQHLAFTPLCRMGDAGTTPSEIIANDLDKYEWQYQWNNFRTYRKFWNVSAYANIPGSLIDDSRRFIPMWWFDWDTADLTDSLRRQGFKNPDPNGSDVDYYIQLTNKFNAEMSRANMMVAAFHKAVIQQTSGERPFTTTYDKFYGDVTQQGIILDKLFAMQSWVALWPTGNIYDQNQAGSYLSSYEGYGDGSFNTLAEDVVTSMVGGQYDVYTYFRPLAVAQFAQDTHDPYFGGNVQIRDWIGGHVFNRQQDFLDFFRGLAVEHSFDYDNCDTLADCQYDPQLPQKSQTDIYHSDTFNEFIGPDLRRWTWAYIASRNQWIAVDRDRNIASYLIIRDYNQDLVNQQDDGNFPGGAYGYELELKYFLDAFTQYN